jgi:hypothetical protein
MPFVMVPVPEDHVLEVMQFIVREMAEASAEPWDGASIAEFFDDVDEASRSLLAYTARASLGATDLTEGQAATMMQIRQGDVAGITRELNDRAMKANRPALLVRRAITETLPNGRTAAKPVLWMSDEVAHLVREAERAELADVRPPLADRPG